MKKSIGAKTILYPNPVLLVGTYDDAGIPNLMTVSWGGICCSDPPCVAISVRSSRYSYRNILMNKAFTVNIPSDKFAKESDYCGIYSGRDENKFETQGLTPTKSELVNAPIVEEFPIALICKLKEIVEIGSHIQFIGEIVDIIADEELLNDKYMPIIEKVRPILYDYSSKAYYSVGDKVLDGFSNIKKQVE